MPDYFHSQQTKQMMRPFRSVFLPVLQRSLTKSFSVATPLRLGSLNKSVFLPVFCQRISQYHASAMACGKQKLKTRKAAAKRFIVCSSGRIKRNQAGKKHLNMNKLRKQLRRLGEQVRTFFFCLINIIFVTGLIS
jgi:ribosomal protein L35